MDINKKIKPRIPLPSFTFNTALTFKKVPNKSYKQAKKLLFVAKSSNGKVSSKEEKKKQGLLADSSANLPKDKFSLNEKLAEIYLEISKKRKTRDGSFPCFIKCNYLEELVMQEDLSYFIMKIYETKLFLYYKNPYRVKYFYHAKVDEESDLFDSIDKEEIPACIIDQIMMCENWFLMYDYHCFLQIQKYAYEDECAEPIFSEFVLLKPTTKLLIELVNKSAYETNNNNGSSHEELKEKYESKICIEISGPLYLDIHPAAQDLMNLLKIYQSPFGCTSLKDALAERPLVSRQSEINPYQEELLKILEERIQERSSSPDDMDFEFSGTAFDYENWKEELQSFLEQRYIGVNSDDMYSPTTFVELFELTTEKFTRNDCSSSELMKTYLSVFWKNGMFYSCLTLEKYIFDPDVQNDFLSLIGKKQELDRYIFKVAEGLSCSYNKDLNIYYKNMITNRSLGLFFPIPEPQSFNPEAFTNYRDDSTKKKSMDIKDDELFKSETFMCYRDTFQSIFNKKKSIDAKYDESLSGHSSNPKIPPFVLSDSDSDEEESDLNLSSHPSFLQKSFEILNDSYAGEEEIEDLLKYTLGHSSNLKGSYMEDEGIDNLFGSTPGHSSYAKDPKTEIEEIEKWFKLTQGHTSDAKGPKAEYVDITNLIKLTSGHSSCAKGSKTENVDIDNLFKSTSDHPSVMEADPDHEKHDSDMSTSDHPSVMEADPDHEKHDSDTSSHITDILNSSLLTGIFSKTESKEAPNLQRDHQSSSFDDRFKEGKKLNFYVVFKHMKFKIENYPHLNAKFEFSKEDYMTKSINHNHRKRSKRLLSRLLPRKRDYL